MSPITWKKELSVGNAEIDAQHQWLIEMVNRLYLSVDDGRDKAATVTIINDLLNYAWTHFRTEEDLFREIDVPDAAEHIEEHERFTARVIAFRTRFVTIGENILPELVDFLSEWLTAHLRDADSRYVPYLLGKR
jgi:hemerythrin